MDVAIVEFSHPPGARTRHHHLVEEVVLVLSGRGRTTITGPPGREHTFRWRAGDVFRPPLGAFHQHVSEAKPWDTTRLLVVRNRAVEHAFGAEGLTSGHICPIALRARRVGSPQEPGVSGLPGLASDRPVDQGVQRRV